MAAPLDNADSNSRCLCVPSTSNLTRDVFDKQCQRAHTEGREPSQPDRPSHSVAGGAGAMSHRAREMDHQPEKLRVDPPKVAVALVGQLEPGHAFRTGGGDRELELRIARWD